jgi:hypothetical protein
MVDLVIAEAARQTAVTRKTHADEDRALRRWNEFIESIGIQDDPFLDTFTRHQRNILIGAFAMAVRSGRFSGQSYDTLAAGTVSNTISYLASAFRKNGRPNPSLDEDRRLSILLSRQYRAYRNKDPPTKQQKALPCIVLKEMNKLKVTPIQIATVQLAIVGFFFAMRSCEYLKVPQAEQHRTVILRLRNIRFFKDGIELGHDSPFLEYADCV